MIIGVISDTHGDVEAWRKSINGPLKGVDVIIHAGDILYHGPRNPIVAGYNPQALAEEINASPIPLLFAKGNCDADVDQMLIKYPIHSPYVFAFIEGRNILAVHGADMNREEMLQLARYYNLRFFISGHTHVPSLEKIGETIYLNPGSCSLPKENNPPTVAVIGEQEVVIISIDSGQELTKLTL
ncbi:phosphodiesterase, family [Thermincola ferriacetica]|uniref:Phosphoesterase n=1 Tax=Thermincola ferriacetica TaxID=281456 RepID=A0A0L6VZC2_9FIRM|nr:phosphodiesterase [Thermincola ferriacetica]KNZ68561.1 phosphodiesterase, family [Thermincola ferriacetica]